MSHHVAKLGEGLTRRESDIYACICRGMSVTEVARHLGISTKTVKNRTTDVWAKVGPDARRSIVSGTSREINMKKVTA